MVKRITTLTSLALDAASGPAFYVDDRGVIVATNELAEAFFGGPKGDPLQGRHMSSLPASLFEALSGLSGNEHPAAASFEEEYADRVFAFTVYFMHDSTEGVRYAAISQDVTEAKRAAEEVRRERQRFFYVLESMPGCILLLDTEQIIRYANRKSRKAFRCRVGQTCRSALNCRDHDCNSCPALKSITSESAVEWEATSDEAFHYHLISAPMTDIDGSPAAILMALDITDRKLAEKAVRSLVADQEAIITRRTARLEKANKQLETEVQERARAEEHLERLNETLRNEVEKHKRTARKLEKARGKAIDSSKAKSQFLASMSHEMRTPLNVILGMTQIARREVGDEPVQRRLEMIAEAGNSLLNVINDLLDFSKIEARKIAFDDVEFDLPELLQNCYTQHSVQAEAKHLNLHLEISPQTPRVVCGDPGRLEQVLNNLLSNALKFTSKGDIRLQVGPCGKTRLKGQPRRKADHDLLCFTVRDTGHGIPPDKLESIFDSFQQADATITRRFGGTGLGLSISRQLVQLMGGAIQVESREGEGSAFTFSVQLRRGEDSAMPLSGAYCDLSPETARPLRILLAEDSDMNAEMVETLLSMYGHQMTRVADGEAALEQLRDHTFDLVLMDVQMPVMDGVTATKRIRGADDIRSGADIPVLVMTAYSMKGDKRKIMQSGATDYIAKPIDVDDLLRKITALTSDQCATPDDASTSSMEAPTEDTRADTPAVAPADQPENPQWRSEREQALAALRGKENLLYKMTLAFLRDTPADRKRLEDALQRNDSKTAVIMAHKIKGDAAAIGAGEASRVAMELEKKLRRGELDGAEELRQSLDAVLERTLDRLEREVREAE